MKPDNSYTQLQIELRRSVRPDFDRFGEIKGRIRKQLAEKFMAAWQFAPDRRRMGAKFAAAVSLIQTKKDGAVRGLDHCTYYTGANDQRIIVTQPYGVTAAEVLEDLTLLDGSCPEVIDASEWGFHYPHEAKLFILKFPAGYREAMERHEKEMRRVEHEKLFGKTEVETDPEREADNMYAWADAND
jgi:hypothetical protein